MAEFDSASIDEAVRCDGSLNELKHPDKLPPWEPKVGAGLTDSSRVSR